MTLPAMMFAAGFGTRMGALTRSTPKPLVRVAGKPLIDHSLALLKEAGCQPIVANVHYLPDQLTRHLATTGVKTITEAEILETGGGLKNALPLLGSGPVVTSNTDAVWSGPNPVTQLLDHWNPELMDGLLMLIPSQHAIGHVGTGDFLRDGINALSRGPGEVYSGVQIMSPAVLHQIKDQKFSLNLAWDIMLRAGRLFGLSYQGKWCDVGHPEGITHAHEMLGYKDV